MLLAVREYLQHILDAADYLDRNSKELTKNAFLADEPLQRAFVRSIEIIGEAVKHLSDEVRRDSPEIEWRLIAGMRDRLFMVISALITRSSGTWWSIRYLD